MDVEEVMKLKLIKVCNNFFYIALMLIYFFSQEIGLTHAKIVDGLTTLLCLSGMLSRMYLAVKNTDEF